MEVSPETIAVNDRASLRRQGGYSYEDKQRESWEHRARDIGDRLRIPAQRQGLWGQIGKGLQ